MDGKTAPRVTEESIKRKIANVNYYSAGEGATICVISMRNGFKVVGFSAPASLANYDANVGMRYAYDNAFKQLWGLEGYLLRSLLSGEVDPPMPANVKTGATPPPLPSFDHSGIPSNPYPMPTAELADREGYSFKGIPEKPEWKE